MKNILNRKDVKISDKAFLKSICVSALCILMCLVALCSSTYAWFVEETSTGSNTVMPGRFYLDVSVTFTDPEANATNAVNVITLSDGAMRCTLDKNTTYTVVLSLSEGASVKGFCDISIGGENQTTEPLSNDPAIGKSSLSFTVTTGNDGTTAVFTPKWGYPAEPTLTDESSIVLRSDPADDGEYIISVLGDSISTFSGYIPEGNLTYYPVQSINVKNVNDTWWMQLITELDAKLGVNDSWSGSLVGAVSGERLPMASVDRIARLDDNGIPDVIVFFGGTNDIAYANGRPMGSFDPENAPAYADPSATEWESFADGYAEAILRLKYYYPDTEIIAILPTLNKKYYNNATLESYNSISRSICDHYGITYVDLVAEGFTASMLGDATHPNASGMDFITEAVKKILLANNTNTDSADDPAYGDQD